MTPPAAAPAVRARTLAPPRRVVPAPRPRRVSGPARPARLRQPAAEAARAERGLLQRISLHLPIDRLIRGRAWIAIVVFALLGIVTLQLMLLKLNAGIGHSLERAALLQRENAALSIENSELAAGGRVEAAAERLGMSLVPAGSLKFLTARPHSDLSHAAGVLSAPASVSVETSGASPSATSAARSESAEMSKSGEAPAVSETHASTETEAATGTSTSHSEAGAESSGPVNHESHESTPAPASSEKEVTSTTAGASEAGPGGGTQAGPTG